MENIDEDCAVKIAVRERPLFAIEEKGASKQNEERFITSEGKVLIVDNRPYIFDHIIGPEANQEDLYCSVIQPLVNKTLQGFDSTVFAYGQTGTGKTYTMGLQFDVSVFGIK